jgi:hypothetical protein
MLVVKRKCGPERSLRICAKQRGVNNMHLFRRDPTL